MIGVIISSEKAAAAVEGHISRASVNISKVHILQFRDYACLRSNFA
ncbi:MAG TPA: hypothetical protein VE244_13410 [Nitrososphaeraceae archaeon]|nr:hypothetical protein [Nitrososphaeraceae archaeon]